MWIPGYGWRRGWRNGRRGGTNGLGGGRFCEAASRGRVGGGMITDVGVDVNVEVGNRMRKGKGIWMGRKWRWN